MVLSLLDGITSTVLGRVFGALVVVERGQGREGALASPPAGVRPLARVLPEVRDQRAPGAERPSALLAHVWLQPGVAPRVRAQRPARRERSAALEALERLLAAVRALVVGQRRLRVEGLGAQRAAEGFDTCVRFEVCRKGEFLKKCHVADATSI